MFRGFFDGFGKSVCALSQLSGVGLDLQFETRFFRSFQALACRFSARNRDFSAKQHSLAPQQLGSQNILNVNHEQAHDHDEHFLVTVKRNYRR